MALLTRMSGGLFLSLAVALAWAGSETVGNLGDPDQIQFVGNDTFASRQLRSALGCNLDVLLAGHPEAPLDELLRLLEQRIVEGYRHCGFQAATVTARHVDERAQIVVAINEGLP